MTDAPLPTTSYAVLGLLSFAPMSGYDLSTYAEKTIGHFWPISRSQIYAELSRLEELGLTRGRDVPQEGVPDKRVYTLTPAGAEALDGWVRSEAIERQRLRSGFLLKTFFAHRMPRQAFVDMLEEHRRYAEGVREHLQAIVDLLEPEQHAFFARATALYGLRSTEASLRWADELLETLPPAELFDFEPEDAAEHAHAFFKAAPRRKDAS